MVRKRPMKDVKDAYKSKGIKEAKDRNQGEEVKRMAEKAEADKSQTKLKIFL